MADVSVDERSAVVLYDPLQNFKMVDDVVTNKVSHSSSSGLPKSYCLDRFGVALLYSKDPYVPSGRRIDGGYEIEKPRCGIAKVWINSRV